MTLCPLCETVITCQSQQHPLLIHEFAYTYWLFGQHQFYRGYSLLISKQHARELHHLSEETRNGIWQELMQVGSIIENVFQPWKLNYASYGNQVEHIHWHIFPRYADEPTRTNCPFSNDAAFQHHPTKIENLIHEKILLQQALLIN